jgi:hypothetical protein
MNMQSAAVSLSYLYFVPVTFNIAIEDLAAGCHLQNGASHHVQRRDNHDDAEVEKKEKHSQSMMVCLLATGLGPFFHLVMSTCICIMYSI